MHHILQGRHQEPRPTATNQLNILLNYELTPPKPLNPPL